MDTDFILKQVQCMEPPSFSVREQNHYRAEVSLENVNIKVNSVELASEVNFAICLAQLVFIPLNFSIAALSSQW